MHEKINKVISFLIIKFSIHYELKQCLPKNFCKNIYESYFFSGFSSYFEMRFGCKIEHFGAFWNMRLAGFGISTVVFGIMAWMFIG